VDLQKDADDAWQNEVSALNQLRELNHPNLIRHIAAITRGDKHFLMFYWAQGGNLRDFWRRDKTPNVTPELVRDVLQQLRGMAEALQKLHEFRGEGHFRHGDIKPENILAFPSPAPSQTGIFKISDLGSAQYHAIATRLRERTPGKSFATMLYQAPEAVTKKQAALTRLYDIWSMGCVTLEFMVWLLYGYHELEAFTQSLRGKLNEPNCFFVDEDQPSATGPTRVAYVHPTVQACFDHLSKDPECTGDMALGQLLKVVQTKLLVINLPESTSSSPEGGNITVTDTDAAQAKTPPPPGGHRTDAAGFVRALDDILRHEDSANSHFWVTGKPRINTGLARNLPKSVTRSSSPHLSVPNWASPSGQRANRPRSLSPRVTSDIHVDGPGQGQVVSTGPNTLFVVDLLQHALLASG
jgi:serine/threonine protein kinase